MCEIGNTPHWRDLGNMVGMPFRRCNLLIGSFDMLNAITNPLSASLVLLHKSNLFTMIDTMAE